METLMIRRVVFSFFALSCAFLSGIAITSAQKNPDAQSTERVRGLNPTKPLSQYVFEAWRNDNGFQQSGVRALYQTRDGYLWIGAAEGLVRFDGARFVTFDKSNLPLKSSAILSLLEDKSGAFWIGTEQGLLCIREGKFTLYTTKEGLPDNVIFALTEDTQGNVWIGTENGLAMFQGGRFTKFTTDNGLTSATILSLASDLKGGVWVGTSGGGVNHFEAGRFTPFVAIEGQFRPYTLDEGLVGDGVHALLADRNGTLWIGSNDGLFKVQNNAVVSFYNTAKGLAKNDVRTLSLDREGTLWIGTNGGGVCRLTSAEELTSFTSQQGLGSDEVFALLEDREGALWMGTDGGGIGRFKDRRFSAYTAKDGLSNN
ncbi:MAG: hypothetical protein JNN25_11940, partial [Candidatus Kapabacteria bacterium]|nr:hypothetical protein [Candidatus Kapabacteria bacterium]